MFAGRHPLDWSGVAGALVGFGTTLLATALSPAFSWTGSALSDLGARTAATPLLFNGVLVVAGVVALPFAAVLWRTAGHRVERVGAVAFAATVVSLVLIGAFPTGTDPHLPASVGFFVLLTLTLWIHGSGAVLSGTPARGLASLWLGIAHVVVWTAWLAGLRLGDGIAIPEFAGSLVLLVWVGLATAAVRRDRAGRGP